MGIGENLEINGRSWSTGPIPVKLEVGAKFLAEAVDSDLEAEPEHFAGGNKIGTKEVKRLKRSQKEKKGGSSTVVLKIT
ncbi:UNVERIFIED_CONTAM: hypothetical protein K2H54_050133 [Gekko kuhli]